MPRALVTGGAGFIGSHLCAALLERGFDVTCVDNFATGSRSSVDSLGVRVIEGDANVWQTYEPVLGERFDVLFHYAAVVGVRRTEEQPGAVLSDAAGMQTVARLAREGVVAKIVFASSSEVYGQPPQLPLREEDGIYGWSPYTVVKLYGEEVFKALWVEFGIPTVSLRFFNVYGPRQIGSDYGFVISRFLNQALAGESPTVFGTGGQTRDFVYVADNVAGALAAFESERAHGYVTNVGTGVETTVKELARLVLQAAGAPDSLRAVYVPARAVEIARRCASTTVMEDLLGVQCSTGLAEGLGMTVRALAQERVRAVGVLEETPGRMVPATS